jgi:SAM-dependent methyltransferase
MNVRSSGKSDMGWHAYCLSLLRRELLGRARMLVVGRESEWLEKDLLRRNVFERCDVVGSPVQPKVASLSAHPENAFARIRYFDADLNSIRLPRAMYDAVWCDVTLCRVPCLEHLVVQIAQSLQPEGFLFAYEYVGADRLAIGPAQRSAVRAAFSLIPARYRHAPETPEKVLKESALPAPGGVPESASLPIASSRVLRVLRDHLDLTQCRAVGGTLLQFVLQDIAGNFQPDDRIAVAVLEMLFAIEDALIDSGELESDFMLIAAKAK